jgi:hypothetical protein
VLIDLRNAEAAEVQFGIESQGTEKRYVCRLTRDKVEIGERAGERGEYLPRTDVPPRTLMSGVLHGFVVERQPTGWFVDVDDLPLVALPHRTGSERPEVRLGAVGGPAQFYELQLTELVVPEQQAASK